MANELENSNEVSETKTETKVDTSALEAELKAVKAERDKLKQSVTNASADASEWKKKYQAKLSDEDKAREEQEAANAALQKELETLRAERNIASYKAALTASDIGMDVEGATAVAEALNGGDINKVLDGIRKFIESHDKALAEKAMMNNPKLQGGNSTSTVTKEQFLAMGYKDMVAFRNEHPDLYEEYMGRKT